MKRFCLLLAIIIWALPAHAGERILALSPHACEVLFAIGARDEVVGVGEYCDFPAAARHLPRVGNHQRIYVEAALRLKPTMVVAMQKNLAGLSLLEAKGVRAVASNPRSLAGLLAEVRRLGRLSGHGMEAERLATGLGARLQALRRHGTRRVRVFYEVWAKPLMTVGADSYLTDVLAAAGGANVFAAVAGDSLRVNVEAVLHKNPEAVLIPDTADVGQRRAFWRRWLGGKVRILTVKADLLNRPGPRLFDGLEELSMKLFMREQGS